jgi:adenine-specific DNA-methyltransferase
MVSNKQKLELTWIGKENRPKLEPRILLEDPTKSYHAQHRVKDDDIFDNKLIFGDNLLALKALEQDFTGKIKCIYIDPPYNTGQAFEHYEDGIEHSIWLGLMRERFELLKKLLAKNGTIFCQLNDDEMAYGKVLLDEVFGRANFLNQVSVKMKQTAGASGGGEDKRLKKNIEYILIYTRDKDGDGGFQSFNEVYDEEDLFEVIEDMRAEGKSWKYTRILKSLGQRQYLTTFEDGSGQPIKIYRHENVVMTPISQICNDEKLSEQECYGKYFDKIFRDTNAQSSIRTRVMEAVAGQGDFFSIEYVPRSGKNKGREVTLYYKGNNCDLIAWLKDVAVKKGERIVKLEKAGTYWEGFPLNNLTKEGGVLFPQGKKPEALIQKVLELSTETGDWVLDSFGGSGTTGAVAQKMGRRWIMVELGEHCHTHIIPRMKKVIDGADTGGITPGVAWSGGGGFRYYYLAPSLLKTDKWGNLVINKEFNADMLSEAVCKLEGYTYAPSDTLYWQHGHSSEKSFIYITTQHLTREQLTQLNDEVGSGRSLLICCAAFRGKPEHYPNLEIKKIPKAVLAKCEWGHDDYSLKIENLPKAPAPKGQQQLF